jgi:hypothetical protein
MDQKPATVSSDQEWDEAQIDQALHRLNMLHVKVCPVSTMPICKAVN